MLRFDSLGQESEILVNLSGYSMNEMTYVESTRTFQPNVNAQYAFDTNK